MPKDYCRNPLCWERRRHYEDQDTPRGQQAVETDIQLSPEDPAFCSFTCAIMDGWMTVKYSTKEEDAIRQAKWRTKHLERLKNHGR